MKKNEYLKFPLTGDLIRVMSYSPEDFNAIKEFILVLDFIILIQKTKKL